MHRRFTTSDGTDIRFADHGSGPPLLLLHGFGGTGDDFVHVFDVEALTRSFRLIVPDARWGPPSTVETAFRSALRAGGFSVIVAKSANLGDPMSPTRVGLQPGDFQEAMQNAANAGAVVSIAGAPLLAPADMGRLSSAHPPILVVATLSLGEVPGLPGNRAQLESLLDAKIIQIAFVDSGAKPGESPTGKSDAVHELFAANYRILRQSP